MNKKVIAAVAACALCLGLLAACAGQTKSASSAASASSTQAASQATSATTGKIKVVCATFPAYDWVRQVVGDRASDYEITYLMGSGVDLHSYQPTVADIAKISDANLFVYVGGESDKWATDAVAAAANANLRTVNMLKAVGSAAVAEEVVEGMQPEGEGHGEEAHEGEKAHGGEEGYDHDHDSAESPEYDEHVWLSLRNAQTLVDAIAGELGALDSANASVYTANAKAYKDELAKLDGRYAEAVKGAGKNTLVFADRFPFRYLVDDYSLKYYAAFPGCSAETEASFETVAFLARKVDELGLSSVFAIEGSDQQIARTVIANTSAKNQQIRVLDSLQSATDADVAAGKTYLSAMEANLAVLEAALA